jgi:hypothetical protein
MQSWVKPFLKKILKEQFGNPKPTFELNYESFIHCVLAGRFNIHFGGFGESDFFMELFGSVLVRLPKYVFEKLLQMSNVFYVFTPHDGAEVKSFNLGEDLRKGQKIVIVDFPYSSIITRPVVARGVIVHELAHIYKGHTLSSRKREIETDQLAKSWGFKKEIRAVRDYWKEKELQKKEVI